MQTGVISFCDRVAYNIKSSEAKREILADLEGQYGIKIIQRHWQPMDLSHLKRVPHLACLRSNGNPYICTFCLHDDVPTIMFIDLKVQPGYELPRIILGRGMFSEEIYAGTVLNGEMVKCKDDRWLFLVNDVIAYKGAYLENVPLPQRIDKAYEMFDKHYTPDDMIDMCAYQVKKYTYATRDGLEALLKLSEELPYTQRGLYVWPFYMKFKPKLMNFDDSIIKQVHRAVKDTTEFREAAAPAAAPSPQAAPAKSLEDSPRAATPIKTGGANVASLRKTENPDVYEVFYKGARAGVAHVPTLAASRMLRAVFRDLTVAVQVQFTCEYNETFGKWQPISKVAQDG